MTPTIGQLIEHQLRHQQRSVTWFANHLCCTRGNVYRLFEKSSVDTFLLLRISRILDFDFFQSYSEFLAANSTSKAD